MLDDRKTVAYFDEFTPTYDPGRFDFAFRFVSSHARPGAKLVDLGCGDGAVLDAFRKNTPIEDVTGMDVSRRCLAKARELTRCQTVHGSILDSGVVEELRERFDYCVLGSVLHHLIGATRGRSYQAARACLSNALLILRSGGHLLLYEPTYSPVVLLTCVFWAKKLVSSLSGNRFEVMGRHWANLGQPVVSYLSRRQLMDMVDGLSGARVVERHVLGTRRFGLMIKKERIALILHKLQENPQ